MNSRYVALALSGLLIVSAVFAVASSPMVDTASALTTADGFEYELTNGGNTTAITGYSGAGGDLVIPSTIDGHPVTSINDSAFAGSGSIITSVVIPDSVVTIGDSAFAGCYATSVTIGNGVTTIADQAFDSCELTSVVIPDSVTSIGYQAFYRCNQLVTVTIGSGVTTIGDAAFYICTSLSSISVSGSNPAFTSFDSALYNKNMTRLIVNPPIMSNSVTIPDGVTDISPGAFSYCTGLASVTIPASVDNIGDVAFGACTALTSITFLGLTSPSYVGTNWTLGTNSALVGHAHADSNFPAPGEDFYGLTMGATVESLGNPVNDPENNDPGTSTPSGLPISFRMPDLSNTSSSIAAVAIGSGLAVGGVAAASAAASGTGSVGTATTSTIAGRPWWKRFLDFMVGGAQESTKEGITEVMNKDKKGSEPVQRASLFAGISAMELAVVLLTSVFLGLAFMISNKIDLSSPLYWAAYIVVAGLAMSVHDLAHRFAAWKLGAVSEYKFWAWGAIGMFVTAIPFGVVYSSPSRLAIKDEEKLEPKKQALIFLAGPLVSVAMFAAFMAVTTLGGRWATIGLVGAAMNLLAATYAMMPFRFLDGHKVYQWRKAVWAAAFVPMFAVYFLLFILL
jgi:Zn-dependent protease